MKGYIKLYRSIVNNWLWEEPRKCLWWIQMLFMAQYENKSLIFNNKVVYLKRGQFATTSRALAKKFGCTRQTMFRFLEILEKDKMIEIETSKTMTIITILNYEKFQGDNNDNEIFTVPHDNQKSNQFVTHNKKFKEIKKKNNSKDSNENLKEEKILIERSKDTLKTKGNELPKSITIDEGIRIFKEDIVKLESFCIANKVPLGEIDVLLSLFKDHCLKNGKKEHPDLFKFMEHFRNSLKYLVPKLKGVHAESKENSYITPQETLKDYSDTDFGGRKY